MKKGFYGLPAHCAKCTKRYECVVASKLSKIVRRPPLNKKCTGLVYGHCDECKNATARRSKEIHGHQVEPTLTYFCELRHRHVDCKNSCVHFAR